MAANDPLNTATGGYLGTSSCSLEAGGQGGCGTGLSQVTFPGDPDLNNGALIARGTFAGITLSWILPERDYAIGNVRVFRSTSDNFSTAAQIATSQGSYYFDEAGESLVQGIRYYYWVVFVSINGTAGTEIGPASAVMQPLVDQLLDQLEGRITNSALAQELREPINNIGVLASQIDQETAERLGFQDVLNDLYGGLQEQLEQNGTLIYDEVATRANADQALAVRINGLGAKLDDNIALIKEEQVAIVTQTEGLVADYQQLDLRVGDNEGAIQTTKEIVGGPDGLTAQYFVKVQNNNLVSGFGLYNDGQTSDFIVNANTFAVATPGTEAIPFFVTSEANGETVIGLNAKTLIRDGQITTAMIDQYIQSSNFGQSGSPGWRLDKDGSFELRGAGGIPLIKTLSNGTVEWDSAIENGSVEWDDIQGDNRPDDGADVTNQNDFMPVLGWTFNGTSEGWSGFNSTLNNAADYVNVRPTASNGSFIGPLLTNSNDDYWLRGTDAPVFRARIRYFGSADDWVGQLVFIDNTGTQRTIASFPYPGGDWTNIEADLFSNSTWRGATIRQIRLRLGRTETTRVDWVSLGKRGGALTPIDNNNVGIYMRDATIGSAQIADAQVGTLKIQDNAVTVPMSVKTAVNALVPAGQFVNGDFVTNAIRIQSKDVYWETDPEDRPKKVIATGFAKFEPRTRAFSAGDPCSIYLGIQIGDNGGIVYAATQTLIHYPGSCAVTWEAPVPAGVDRRQKFSLWAWASAPEWVCDRAVITILGAKR